MASKIPAGAFSVHNAGRFSWERNDCSVRAVALALKMPYAEAHARLKAAGRPDGKGCYASAVTIATGIKYIRAPRITAAQFMREHPNGIYIVFVTGHFFALINGQQLDMGEALYRPRQRLWGYWEVAAGVVAVAPQPVPAPVIQRPVAPVVERPYARAKQIVAAAVAAGVVERKAIIAQCVEAGIKYNTADSAHYEVVVKARP